MLSELDAGQARQLIDVQQVFSVWSQADHDRARRYAGSMHWKTIDGRQYLYRKLDSRRVRSLGPRNSSTEIAMLQFQEGLATTLETLNATAIRLDEMAQVNKALRLNRVPGIVGRILRGLEKAELLGRQISVVGTHALFAYEVLAGIHFNSDLLATGDVDFLYDARRKLKLRAPELKKAGLLGILKRVDRSFSASARGSFRAQNKHGFLVDLIAPSPRNQLFSVEQRLGEDGDLVAAEIRSLVWLQSVPSVSALTIDERGYPARITAPHPLAFAAYKRWLSQAPGREPLKRGRDKAQGDAVFLVLPRLIASVPELNEGQLPGPLRPFAYKPDTPPDNDLRPEPNW